jgi:hypothetical protein
MDRRAIVYAIPLRKQHPSRPLLRFPSRWLLTRGDEVIEQRWSLLQRMSPLLADFVAEVAEEERPVGAELEA